MANTRIVMLALAGIYLATNLIVSAQGLEQRITRVETRLAAQMEPAIERLQSLEARIFARDLSIEGRLVALEESVATSKQLLLAIGIAVLIQLTSSAIGIVRSRRKEGG